MIPLFASVGGMAGGFGLGLVKPNPGMALLVGSTITGVAAAVGGFTGSATAGVVHNRGGEHTESDAAHAGVVAAAASVSVVALAALSLRTVAKSHRALGAAVAVASAASAGSAAYGAAVSIQLHQEAEKLRSTAASSQR